MFNLLKWFKSEPYVKTIHHEDWKFDEDGGNCHFRIPKKEHGKRRPRVEFDTNERIRKCVGCSFDGDDVIIKRGLAKWQGTPFSLTVKIL